MADDLARDAAPLFTVSDGSPVRALYQLAELVAARVRGCCGATATLWELDEVAATAASHPELAALAEQQFTAGDGPIIAALRTGEPAVTADTLHEPRWPQWAAAALAAGVRSSTTLMHEYGPLNLTLSLYGVRPEAFDPDQLPLVSLLAAFGTTAVASAAEQRSARRSAAQLEEAIRSRAVVDQAKGILMQLTGCEASEAFERLRRISQTQHVKLTEVARQVIETRAQPGQMANAVPEPARPRGPDTSRRARPGPARGRPPGPRPPPARRPA